MPAVADIRKLFEFVDSTGKAEAIDFTSTTFGDRDVRPQKEAIDKFVSIDAAMIYGARPICTLEEYIAFRNRAPLTTSPKKLVTIRQGTDNWKGKGAICYEKILELTPGPGEPPLAEEAAGRNYPMTAEDWNKKLLRYRRRIYDGTVPLES